MQPNQSAPLILPPGPKTTRGQPTAIECSPTHLLYFNGCSVILRPTDNSSALFITHSCLVTAVKFSHGFRYVASIDEKGTLLINEIQKGEVKIWKTYQGVFIGTRSIDWTSDNKRICVVGSGKNKYGRVISVDTGSDLGQISAVTANLSTASFRPEKPYKLIVGGEDHIVKFYEGPPYKFKSSKKSHKNFINQVKYNPDGSKIISVGSDRKITLYDGMSCEIIKQLENAHEGGVMGVAWIDNETFVTVGSDKKIKKWNINLENVAERISNDDTGEFGLVDSFIVGVCYQVETQKVYFVLLSGQIRQTDKNLGVFTQTFEGARGKAIKIAAVPNGNNNAVVLDSNGKILEISTLDSRIHRYLRKTLCNNKILLDFCINKSGVLHYVTGESQIGDIDLRTKLQPQKIQTTKVEGVRFISSLGFQNTFVALSQSQIKVFEGENGKYALIGQSKLSYEPTSVLADPQAQNIVYVGSGKGKVQIFEVSHNQKSAKVQKIAEFHPNQYKVSCIYRHNDLLFTGDSMGGIKVHLFSKNEHREPKKVTDSMGSHTTLITSILAAPETNTIYTFSLDNKYSVWALDTYKRITTLNDVHKHGIVGAELIGGNLVTVGGDSLIKVHRI